MLEQLTQPAAQPEGDDFALDQPEASAEEKRARQLDSMGEALAKKRSDAIAARQASGIEQQWLEDEEFYQGIDDANRGEVTDAAWRTKPPGQVAGKAQTTTRSTIFVNITRPYVDAASARIADMLLPTDDRSWSLGPTPIPDLIDLSSGKVPPDIQRQIQSAPGATAETVARDQQAVVDQAAMLIAESKKKAEKAQKRIEDWNVEGQWHSEIRKVIEDAARCGAGVLKGPYPVKRKIVVLEDAQPQQPQQSGLLQRVVSGIKTMFGQEASPQKVLVIKEEIKPTSRRIDFWNFYPDGACGENIHNGTYTWERDDITDRQLRDLQGMPGYLKTQIERVLEEGPMTAVATNSQNTTMEARGNNDKRFEIWYYHGPVGKEELEAAGCQCEDEKSTPSIPAMIVMVNGHVIKAALNPLDSGEFPYDVMPWQRKTGLPWGNGVSRQGRTPQRIVTAACRNLMDNGGLSAGPQIVMRDDAIRPADGKMELTPRKVWLASADADIQDVRTAITFVEVPSRQEELMEIIQLGLKLMEDATGLPMLLQGQLGKAPDTVGGMTLLNNNASAVLRRLARMFDDYITEPHIRRYYTWLLQYGEDDEKGDFVIDARGSSALVERDLQAQELTQFGELTTNPIYGIDPKKWADELLKSRKLDPKNFQYDDEQWKQIVASMSQKPADPRTEVAQINSQTKIALQQQQQAFDAKENERERELKVVLEMIDERMATAEMASGERQTLQTIKGKLGDTVIKVRAQKELSSMTPPTEPAGKAPAGQAFQK